MFEEWFSATPSADEKPWEEWFEGISSADTYPYASAIPDEAGLFGDGLKALLLIHFRPNENPPFGPMMVMEGKRTPDVCDIPKDQCPTLVQLAGRIDAAAPRTRLSDLAWEADKSIREAAEQAVAGYLEIIDAVLDGRLAHAHSDRGITFQTCGFVRRAATISRQIGDDEVLAEVRSRADKTFEAALSKGSAITHALALGTNLGLLTNLTERAEATLEATEGADDLFTARDYCVAARQAFARSEDNEKETQAALKASSISEQIARTSTSAMFASMWLQTALDDLQGIRDQKNRKTELYKKLIIAQEDSMEEFASIGGKTDITELVETTRDGLSGLSGDEFLLALFSITKPISIEHLHEEAKKQAAQFPLATIFTPEIVDDSGRVIAKQPSKDHPSGIPTELLHSVFRYMALNYNVVAAGQINIARQIAAASEIVYRTDIDSLIKSSPFIPSIHRYKFVLALKYFMSGEDLISGGLILPCFEDCLRHILRSQGIETSKRHSDGTQKLATLSKVIDHYRDALERTFGVDWVFEAEALFANPLGQRLRHDWAHGRVSDGAAYSNQFTYANWFILRAALLPTLVNRVQSEAVDEGAASQE
ncbi:DUF7380 domain-containing protein [Marinicauda salina]|uniref:DUF7380 domain-containing protein n=1 Tax=Marinicauda salina TaxID=2135793 RepID=UPI0011B1E73D|nr:hypothetical protein [Marinicauda salina]